MTRMAMVHGAWSICFEVGKIFLYACASLKLSNKNKEKISQLLNTHFLSLELQEFSDNGFSF
jgi:hypothetical protein